MQRCSHYNLNRAGFFWKSENFRSIKLWLGIKANYDEINTKIVLEMCSVCYSPIQKKQNWRPRRWFRPPETAGKLRKHLKISRPGILFPWERRNFPEPIVSLSYCLTWVFVEWLLESDIKIVPRKYWACDSDPSLSPKFSVKSAVLDFW
jgi:hypothetical protein